MAGPGTKRTDSPGALQQTPPNQPRGGSSRRPVLGNHRPAADPWRSPYPPGQPMQTSSHKAEGPPQVARCSPPKTDLAEVPSTPGGPSRNSAMPVLRVRGEGVPASRALPEGDRTLAPLPPPASLHACQERPGTVGRQDCRGPPPSCGRKPTTVPGHSKNDLCPIRRRQPIGVCAPSPALPLQPVAPHSEMDF